jgi:hypothetical protein
MLIKELLANITIDNTVSENIITELDKNASVMVDDRVKHELLKSPRNPKGQGTVRKINTSTRGTTIYVEPDDKLGVLRDFTQGQLIPTNRKPTPLTRRDIRMSQQAKYI